MHTLFLTHTSGCDISPQPTSLTDHSLFSLVSTNLMRQDRDPCCAALKLFHGKEFVQIPFFAAWKALEGYALSEFPTLRYFLQRTHCQTLPCKRKEKRKE